MPSGALSDSSLPPSSSASLINASLGPSFDWCVVGGGPAGVACVGQLLEHGTSAASILWVDRAFDVGDFGSLWRDVSSNTTVGLFRRFYRHCKAFGWTEPKERATAYAIDALEDKDTCALHVAAEPLRDVTRRLLGLGVRGVEGTVQRLGQTDGRWSVAVVERGGSAERTFLSASAILCTGAEPNIPSFHTAYPHVEVIPLSTALTPRALAEDVSPADTVVVFGSSHTAVILLRQLLEQTQCGRVVNLYREPLRYALYLDGWILFDDTGLKGSTAAWSRRVLHSALPDRLVRAYSNDASVAEALRTATKVIYATGFHQRPLPHGVEGVSPIPSPSSPSTSTSAALPYNAHCGVIAPGLFGAGIGYPEQRTDRYGNVELRVGLWKFMEYIELAMPLWMAYNVQNGIGQPKGAPSDAAPIAKL